MPVENYQVVVGVIITIVVLVIAVGFIAMLVAYANRRALLYAREKENLELQFREQLLQVQVEIQEQTLQQISRELHDNIGQIASLVKINLSTIRLEDSAAAAAKVEDTKALTRQLIADLRSLSASLNSDLVLSAGFANVLQQLAETLNKRVCLRYRFRKPAMFPPPPMIHWWCFTGCARRSSIISSSIAGPITWILNC